MLSCDMDIFKDTTQDEEVSTSLELDRIKDKVRSIWNALLEQEFTKAAATQEDFDSSEEAKANFMKENSLLFPGEEREADEADALLEMLDALLDEKEELDPVSKEGKAPTYGGKQLSSNNEKSKVEKTTYEVKHSATMTPKDSQNVAKTTTYDKPKGSKHLTSKTHERAKMNIDDIKDILDIERKRLLKVVAERNKRFGVVL